MKTNTSAMLEETVGKMEITWVGDFKKDYLRFKDENPRYTGLYFVVVPDFKVDHDHLTGEPTRYTLLREFSNNGLFRDWLSISDYHYVQGTRYATILFSREMNYNSTEELISDENNGKVFSNKRQYGIILHANERIGVIDPKRIDKGGFPLLQEYLLKEKKKQLRDLG